MNVETNRVYSNRLSISYNTQLTVRRKNHPKTPHNTFIYMKKLFNYNINVFSPSYPYNSSTLKKQTTHRKRLLRLLISQEVIPASAVNIPQLLTFTRHPQPTGPIEFEEIFLSDDDFNSTWLGLPLLSHSSNIPHNNDFPPNETSILNSSHSSTPPVQRVPTSLLALNPMHQ
ncbi:hypothetical protein C1645_837505 [Glomus cerebriforme]|uniref:DUF8211 domain-containing protein n=1 Tax=Glomus cerebriforme TaxID=658196 RepID=A0A397SEC9_9GLOM|nr:hypothetical protein C1645_837505 [Glomus cerebriforme]